MMAIDDRELTAALCRDLPAALEDLVGDPRRRQRLESALADIRAGEPTAHSLAAHGLPESAFGPARTWSPGMLPSGFAEEIPAGSTVYRCPAARQARRCALRKTRDPATGVVPYCNVHEAFMVVIPVADDGSASNNHG
ncbi:hypothetical protein [Dactylosporangium sp. NPDC005555]|uniref:hypothetical protein n=1 Tax=Dactylosporangium sp. NPDC005555 TaxID=3154889 RepID=UPI0033BCCD34